MQNSGTGVGVADLEDVLAVAAYIRSHAEEMNVDLSRGIGVGGHSWGGYLTLMSMCNPMAAGVFSCGMSGAGISDLGIQLRETELRPYDRQILGGWPYEKEQEWRERSAVTNADKLAAPFLIQHGADDLNVPYSQIVEFVAAAEKATAPNAKVTFISYEGEKHGNQKPPNQENCECKY